MTSVRRSFLSGNQPVVGRLALYTLALKSSCFDLNTITFTVGDKSETLLTHLKKQMEQEKEYITCMFTFFFGFKMLFNQLVIIIPRV